MRKRFGQSLRLGVSPYDVALLKVSRWGSPRADVVAEVALGGTGMDAIGAAARQLLSDFGSAGWPLSVVLADDLVRMWQVTPPRGSTRLADLEAAAALRFQSLYGESAGQWTFSAGWDTGAPFLAAAMPRELLALLQQAAFDSRATIVEVLPQFVAGWNRWRSAILPDAWYGLVQAQVLTIGALEGGRVRALRAAAIPEHAPADWLGQHVAREALRLNMAAPARLFVSGQAPATWNNSTAALPCVLLGSPAPGQLSAAARLAATGILS
ncbi:hypothetical protein KY495_01815 [Massilia sp. PAMC28688]|uniref:hypothetical protein n=1 Tax=Massilia sp. PAMC28688 TaxID=2861283 RepID=UPI001C62B71C|nr:hypothetical protein [Massilia sp. PAMC28688]QYF94000.1 hypothetical protein KY495_01815 [Massilia sp. PAMC28688]